jgi:hypothetical protein
MITNRNVEKYFLLFIVILTGKVLDSTFAYYKDFDKYIKEVKIELIKNDYKNKFKITDEEIVQRNIGIYNEVKIELLSKLIPIN